VKRKLIYSVVVLLVVYFLFNLQDTVRHVAAYRQLYKQHAFYVPEAIKTSFQIILCFAAVALALKKRFREICAELRLERGFSGGLLFGFLATLPFLVGLALTHRIGELSWLNLFYLAFFAPFSEELVVRAYGFGQLYRRCGWPVWLGMIATAAIFGWGHIEKGTNFSEAAGLFLLTGIGGAFSAWFYYRWDSIWFPWTIHALMNLYWEIFSVSSTALGGWFPFGLQASTLLLGAYLTSRMTRKESSEHAPVNGV
jgi:uncharacterized protein